MTEPAFLFRMAGRELRAARGRAALLAGTVAVGVSALVAIASFSENLRSSVDQQARTLLGADLAFSSRQPFSKSTEAVLDTLAREGAELARLTSFAAMAYAPKGKSTRLVQVAAVSGNYPFYGEIATQPPAAWRALQLGRNVIVDPSLLPALEAGVGDTLALGEAQFLISGTIRSAPNQVGFRFALGPRIYIPAASLQATGLLGFGARVQYETYAKLPPHISAQAWASRHRSQLTTERVRIRTVAEDQRNLDEVLSRLAGYLGLVALMALLLAGIGAASAAVVQVRQRTESIAVLKCLGATGGQVFRLYLLESGLMGLAGSLVGTLLGIALQQLLPRLLGSLLPVEVVPGISWKAIALGIGVGFWITLVFTSFPLLAVRVISPLRALRRVYESERSAHDLWWGLATVALAASILLLAVYQVGSWRQGVIFAGGAALTLLLLWASAWSLTHTLRRRFPQAMPYVWRQGLANLYRPANQTTILILGIGFGAFLLVTLYLMQHNLLQQLRTTGGSGRPNLVLFDIQSDQMTTVRQELQRAGLPLFGPTSIVPMRIAAINGRPVTTLLTRRANDEEPEDAWALRREYRSTYRDSLVSTERVVEGTWQRARSEPPALISLEQDLARELGVGIGDQIVWDVQGVSLPSRVTSLRAVDWARFEPNFFVVFAPGALERAPQTLVVLTRIAEPVARGRFQRRIAERLPNVSTLDLSVLQEALERLVERVALAIRFMALFSVAVGVLVLVGALATSRFQRIREAALLRTLGATRSQILRVVLAEYLSLGLLATAVALVLATLAAWALARFVFEGSFTIPVAGMSALGAGIVALTVAVGLANSLDVVRRTPLENLREE
ncbi:MAG: ABC transporter permease [Gemmatimonadales bacterium]